MVDRLPLLTSAYRQIAPGMPWDVGLEHYDGLAITRLFYQCSEEPIGYAWSVEDNVAGRHYRRELTLYDAEGKIAAVTHHIL